MALDSAVHFQQMLEDLGTEGHRMGQGSRKVQRDGWERGMHTRFMKRRGTRSVTTVGTQRTMNQATKMIHTVWERPPPARPGRTRVLKG